MSPDLNSLPLSTEEPYDTSPSEAQGGNVGRTSPPSLLQNSSSDSSAPLEVQSARRSPRLRAGMRINLHDPTLPPGVGDAEARRHSPHLYRASSGARREGLTGGGLPSPRSPVSSAIPQGDPHHQRAPSLGELHQELEQEQEAQVNRLLQMIRRQQAQLEQLQSQSAPVPNVSDGGASGGPIMDETSAPSTSALATGPLSSGPHGTSYTSSPYSTRSRSRRSSQASPMHAIPLPDAAASGRGHDEATFYATENQSLQRENQMLRTRIRELEQRLRSMEVGEYSGGHSDLAEASSAAATIATTHGSERKNEDSMAV